MSLSNKNIFEFSDYKEYLRYCQEHHPKRQRRRLSLEEWAQRLGYKSPRTVGMILSGHRFPNEEQSKALIKDLGLNGRESDYFKLLIEREKNFSQGKSSGEIDQKIKKLLGQIKNIIVLNNEHFSYIANWYFLPLRKWIDSPKFEFNFQKIRQAFRDKISTAEIERAFEAMASLGLIDYSPGKSVSGKTRARIKSPLDSPSHAIRLHHTQMLQKGIEAISEVPIQEREFNAWTFRMNPENMEKLKLKIREWGETLTNDVPEDGTEVYQLCVQCFPHSSPVKNVPDEMD